MCVSQLFSQFGQLCLFQEGSLAQHAWSLTHSQRPEMNIIQSTFLPDSYMLEVLNGWKQGC